MPPSNLDKNLWCLALFQMIQELSCSQQLNFMIGLAMSKKLKFQISWTWRRNITIHVRIWICMEIQKPERIFWPPKMNKLFWIEYIDCVCYFLCINYKTAWNIRNTHAWVMCNIVKLSLIPLTWFGNLTPLIDQSPLLVLNVTE